MTDHKELMNLYWTTAGVFPGVSEISRFDFKDRVQAAAHALLSTATSPENPPELVGAGPPGAWPFQPANAAAPAAGGGAT